MPEHPCSIALDTCAFQIRKHDAHPIDSLAARVRGRVTVVPNVVIDELFNSTNWKEHAVKKLSLLFENYLNVWPGASLADLMREELATGLPCLHAFDRRLASRFQYLIYTCRQRPEQAMRDLEAYANATQAGMLIRKTSQCNLRQDSDYMASQIYNALGDDVIQKCINDPFEFPKALVAINFKSHAVDWLADMRTINSVAGLGGVAVSRQFAPDSLYESCSAMVRHYMAMIAYGVFARKQVKYSERADRRILSDHNDAEVVVVGSYCDELYSREKVVVPWIDKALRAAICTLFPNRRVG